MTEPFIGQISLFSFNFAPRGWAQCNGQLLPINQNQALFSLLGTTYGGDGRVNFALPDLRSRVPLHFGMSLGQNYALGQRAGEAGHTLTLSELPTHTHNAVGSSAAADSPLSSGTLLATTTAVNIYSDPTNLVAMSSSQIATTGGSQPHNNTQPTLVINFCIALQGIFPSQT